MIKQQLLEDLKRVVKDLGFDGTDSDKIGADPVLYIPQNKGFGDYATNIALQLSKQKSKNGEQTPLEIANKILSNLKNLSYLSDIEVKGPGFINFFIKPGFLTKDLEEILKQDKDFGKNNIGADKKIQVEFVSANPTGPLTLPHGRGGVLGDTLANVLTKSGFLVEREYYVNDTGNQVRTLGESVLAAAGKTPAKPEHYQGEYIRELAEKFQDKLASPSQTWEPQGFGHLLADYLLESEIKPALLRMGIKFDEFYSERSLYERSLIEKAVEKLKEADLAYEQDGALWFKATKFSDEKDRVLMTSESGRGREEPTYFLSDIAHHLDVLSRGYLKRINVLGADHHGYGQRIKGVTEALGYPDKVDLIFMQMVKLFKDGKEMRMSKRAGTYVTVDELLNLVGQDSIRFFFLMYAGDSPINFDLNIARDKSSKNPVFYVQYAHARMANILKKVYGSSFTVRGEEINYGLLNKKEELELIKHLASFPDLIEEIAKNYQVQHLTSYAITLADLFHKFYENCRVLNAENEELRNARLSLVLGCKIVLGNVLGIMGIDAPERM